LSLLLLLFLNLLLLMLCCCWYCVVVVVVVILPISFISWMCVLLSKWQWRPGGGHANKPSASNSIIDHQFRVAVTMEVDPFGPQPSTRLLNNRLLMLLLAWSISSFARLQPEIRHCRNDQSMAKHPLWFWLHVNQNWQPWPSIFNLAPFFPTISWYSNTDGAELVGSIRAGVSPFPLPLPLPLVQLPTISQFVAKKVSDCASIVIIGCRCFILIVPLRSK